MRYYRRQVSSIALVTLLGMLLASSTVRGQTQGLFLGSAHSPQIDGAIRIGLATPRVSLVGGGGMVPQETISLRRNLSSYLAGPRIGTIDIKARLDSLALEEGKERQCDYVLYTSLIRKRKQAGTGAGGTHAGGTRSGDEFTFGYKLVSTVGMQPVAANVVTATVNWDGQDVLTPMIENAAQAVVDLARAAKLGNSGSNPTVAGSGSGAGYDPVMAARPRPGTAMAVDDPPKSRDAIRIGIVTPRVSAIGGGAMGSGEAASLRQTTSNYLAGSTIETIDLKARLDSLALAEGSKRECDYVLYSSLIRKRSGHTGGGSLGSIVGKIGGPELVRKAPGGKTARDITTQAASVGRSLEALARANDEVTFEYKLVATVGERSVVTKLTKAKVKSEGQDVITPMIEAAAQAIVEVTKKN